MHKKKNPYYIYSIHVNPILHILTILLLIYRSMSFTEISLPRLLSSQQHTYKSGERHNRDGEEEKAKLVGDVGR